MRSLLIQQYTDFLCAKSNHSTDILARASLVANIRNAVNEFDSMQRREWVVRHICMAMRETLEPYLKAAVVTCAQQLDRPLPPIPGIDNNELCYRLILKASDRRVLSFVGSYKYDVIDLQPQDFTALCTKYTASQVYVPFPDTDAYSLRFWRFMVAVEKEFHRRVVAANEEIAETAYIQFSDAMDDSKYETEANHIYMQALWMLAQIDKFYAQAKLQVLVHPGLFIAAHLFMARNVALETIENLEEYSARLLRVIPVSQQWLPDSLTSTPEQIMPYLLGKVVRKLLRACDEEHVVPTPEFVKSIFHRLHEYHSHKMLYRDDHGSKLSFTSASTAASSATSSPRLSSVSSSYTTPIRDPSSAVCPPALSLS